MRGRYILPLALALSSCGEFVPHEFPSPTKEWTAIGELLDSGAIGPLVLRVKLREDVTGREFDVLEADGAWPVRISWLNDTEVRVILCDAREVKLEKQSPKDFPPVAVTYITSDDVFCSNGDGAISNVVD